MRRGSDVLPALSASIWSPPRTTISGLSRVSISSCNALVIMSSSVPPPQCRSVNNAIRNVPLGHCHNGITAMTLTILTKTQWRVCHFLILLGTLRVAKVSAGLCMFIGSVEFRRGRREQVGHQKVVANQHAQERNDSTLPTGHLGRTGQGHPPSARMQVK